MIAMTQQIEAEVKGLGKVIRIAKPFDQALETLKKENARVISAKDLANARIQTGTESSLSRNGSYVKEGLVYVPDKTLFVRNSPFLVQTIARDAVQVHRNVNEFFVNNNFIQKYQEQAETDKKKEPEKRRVLELARRGTYKIPTNRFKDEELTLWLFGKKAQKYGDFLKQKAGINEIPVYLSSNSSQNSANQLWLGCLDDRSSLYGYNRGLDYYYYVRGVLKTGEASRTAEKSPYTKRQIDKIGKLVQGVRQGDLPASRLEKVADFLDKLKQ